MCFTVYNWGACVRLHASQLRTSCFTRTTFLTRVWFWCHCLWSNFLRPVIVWLFCDIKPLWWQLLVLFKASAVSLWSWLNYYVLEILSMISRSYQHIKSHYNMLISSSSHDIIPFIFSHNLKISNGTLWWWCRFWILPFYLLITEG